MIPPGNGQRLVNQININGGNAKTFVGDYWTTQTYQGQYGTATGSKRPNMNSRKEMDELTQGAYDYIKENRSEDGKVIIYGYSWGGVLANHVVKRLKEDNIVVDILFLVDAANGNESESVDRSISENVKEVRNFYNPDRNNNTLSSYGLPVTAKNKDKTKVDNQIK